MTANHILFRASSIGYLMIDPRSKSESLSESTKTHLVDLFVSAKYGRREEIHGKYLDKGNEREEDSITLVSRINKVFYKKNNIRLQNDFVSGECDIYEGESIEKATHTLDTKTSWSAHTFFRAKNKELDKMYYWQGMCYMWLTGANKHTVAYCLVNGTEQAINNEKRQASYRSRSVDFETDHEYIESCKQIEINHIFDYDSFLRDYPHFDFHNTESWKWDIPMEERIFQISFERDKIAIEKMKQRIIDCRIWMDENLFNQ